MTFGSNNPICEPKSCFTRQNCTQPCSQIHTATKSENKINPIRDGQRTAPEQLFDIVWSYAFAGSMVEAHGRKAKRTNDSVFRILYTGMAPCASLQNLEYSDRNLRLLMQCFLAATRAVCQWRKPNPKNKRVQNYRQKNRPPRKCALIELNRTWCTGCSRIFAWALATSSTVHVFASSI